MFNIRKDVTEAKLVNLKTCEQEKAMKHRQEKEWTVYSRHAQRKESNMSTIGIPEGKEAKNEKGEIFSQSPYTLQWKMY